LASKRSLDKSLKSSVLSLLIIRDGRRDQARIERLFEDESMEDYLLSEGLKLLLSLDKESKIAEDILLRLIEESPGHRELLAYALLLPTPKVMAKLENNQRWPEYNKAILKAIELKRRPPASSRNHLNAWISLLDATDWRTKNVILPELMWVQEKAEKELLAAKIRDRMSKWYKATIYLEVLKILECATAEELQTLADAPREYLIDSQWASILQAARKGSTD